MGVFEYFFYLLCYGTHHIPAKVLKSKRSNTFPKYGCIFMLIDLILFYATQAVLKKANQYFLGIDIFKRKILCSTEPQL